MMKKLIIRVVGIILVLALCCSFFIFPYATPMIPVLPPQVYAILRLPYRIADPKSSIPIEATAYLNYEYIISEYMADARFQYIYDSLVEEFRYYLMDRVGYYFGVGEINPNPEKNYLIPYPLAEAYGILFLHHPLQLLDEERAKTYAEEYGIELSEMIEIDAIYDYYLPPEATAEQNGMTVEEFRAFRKEYFFSAEGWYDLEGARAFNCDDLSDGYANITDPQYAESSIEERRGIELEFKLVYKWKNKEGAEFSETLDTITLNVGEVYDTIPEKKTLEFSRNFSTTEFNIAPDSVSGTIEAYLGEHKLKYSLYYFMDKGKAVFTHREGELKGYKKIEQYKENKAIFASQSSFIEANEIYKKSASGCGG